nr:unnamed protein product [Callosobruchus chinensis]
MQAQMPSPNGDTSAFYYKSRLNSENFTVVELFKKLDRTDRNAKAYENAHCYFWDETNGKKGSTEIGSCLLQYLKDINEKTSEEKVNIIFYSDNCCGQNKNKYIATLYLYAVSTFRNIESITHKFLVQGHTQNEGDNVHSLIEKEIKKNLKSGPIYTPQQYIPLIKCAKKSGKPFIIHELGFDFFKDLKHLQENWGYNYNENDKREPVIWNDIKIFRFCKGEPFTVFYKTSYEEDNFQTINLGHYITKGAIMISAVAAVQTKKMGHLKHSVFPERRCFVLLRKKNDSIAEVVDKPIGRKSVLDRDIESQLVDYILVMEGLFYGLTRMDLRRLAYQVANNIENPFREGVAGRYWLKGFLKRHQNILSVRQPTETSYARGNGFTRERMNEFYDNLETIQSTTSFPLSRIFNVDETGLFIVQSKTAKVIARKGKKQIAAMTSAERGSLITIVTCMSPTAIFVPPMIIFPRKNMTNTLMRGAPPGSIGRAHPSGWIQTNLFTEWFEHFLEHVKPSEGSPVLLILDGHYSHTKNIDVIELARQHHVTILSLSPHCTHKVQPLDRAFMGPLKTYYSEQIRVFLRENNRPVSPNIFTDADYVAAAIEQEENEDPNIWNVQGVPVLAVEPLLHSGNPDDVQPGPSSATSNKCLVTPYDISPVPQPKKSTSNKGRKPTKSAIISSSSYKKDLEEAQAKRSKQTKNGDKKKAIKKRTVTRKRNRRGKSDSESSEYNCSTMIDIHDNTDSSADIPTNTADTQIPTEEDAECFFCDGKYSEDREGEEWVKCLMCEMWAHSACAGYDYEFYVCDYCKT